MKMTGRRSLGLAPARILFRQVHLLPREIHTCHCLCPSQNKAQHRRLLLQGPVQRRRGRSSNRPLSCLCHMKKYAGRCQECSMMMTRRRSLGLVLACILIRQVHLLPREIHTRHCLCPSLNKTRCRLPLQGTHQWTSHPKRSRTRSGGGKIVKQRTHHWS
jgi:hypothetical protein